MDNEKPEVLWAAWFHPLSRYKKPKKVTAHYYFSGEFSGNWYASNGNDYVQAPGMRQYMYGDNKVMSEVVMFASEDKAEVQRYIDFANLLAEATKARLGSARFLEIYP